MFPRLLPFIVIASICAFAVGSLSIGLTPHEPRLWRAAYALIALGALTPMIYIVNVRIVPVFSRRQWQSRNALIAMLLLSIAGAWSVFLGRVIGSQLAEVGGAVLASVAGALFVWSLVRLFASPITAGAGPPEPYPGHGSIDRIGTRFTRLAGMYLLLGLGIGVTLTVWTPSRGRWELIWAHSLLIGWMLSMVSGVCYHVLSRWTGRVWKRPRLIGIHYRLTLVAVPLMLLGFATERRFLLALGGTAQALATLLFVWNVLPMMQGLPTLSRYAMSGAVVFLSIGVLIGASIALDPGNHIRLRFTHIVVNLLGFSGLMVSGAGYYLLPRFAGRPLRWPRLAAIQVALHAGGTVVLGVALWWSMHGGDRASVFITYGGATLTMAFLLFAVVIAATFRQQQPGWITATVDLRTQQRTTPQPQS